MRDNRLVLLAHEQMRLPAKAREGDRRIGSTYNRRGRGLVREDYAGHTIVFYPIKFWPARVGVSLVTLRNWINKSIITAYDKFGMHIMCDAELASLKSCVQRWYQSRDMHNAIEPEFQKDLKKSLDDVRTALDTFRRKLPLSAQHRLLLEPSIQGISHAYA